MTPELIDGIDFLVRATQRPRSTVLRWLRRGRIPRPDLVLNRQERYWRKDRLEAWITAQSA